MKRYWNILLCLLLVAVPFKVTAQDSLSFKGQLYLWSNYNPAGSLDLWFGGRYIPQLNYDIRLPDNKLIDFELSASLFASLTISSMVLEICAPRIPGMAQKEHLRSQPSAIFR